MDVVDGVRAAATDDADRIADIFLEARREAMPYLPSVHTDEEVRSWIRQTLIPNHEVYVWIEDDKVEAFVSLADSDLEHLYVARESWGRGFGSQLLAHAKSQRPDGFGLWVFQRNARARSFYEGRGLVLVLLTSGEGNEEGEPDARYEWPGTDRTSP